MRLPPELIESLYEAAFDPAAIPRMLDAVSRTIPSTQAIVTYHDGRAQRPVGIAGVAGDFDTDAARIYMEHYQDNIWSDAVHGGHGRTVVLDGPVPLRTLERDGLYADVLRPTDLAHGIGLHMPVGEGCWMRFGLGRGRAGGIYSAEEAALLDACAAHLRRAIALAGRFDAAAQLRRAELAALDRVATAALLVDRRGRLLLANRAARRLAAGGALMLKDGAAPGCTDRAAAAAFRVCATSAAAGLASPPIRFRDADGLPLILVAAPLGAGAALRLAEAGAAGHAAAALLVHGTTGDAGPPPELLRSLFDLTPAEARVAAEIALGDSERDAAVRLGIGLASLRTHRKRIFAKLGITRRGELIRLCANLPR